MTTPATTSQTVGPYFSIGLSYRNDPYLCSPETEGEHIQISGQVFDGAGTPVTDAQLELWQADTFGRFAGADTNNSGTASAGFRGFARAAVDQRGTFLFHTILPGCVPDASGTPQAPHIVVLLFMRGILKHLYTRIYFDNDPRNETDPVLHAIPAERRATLFARLDTSGQYTWNIHLQGDNETVFFDY
jgi:protocatechuate 3,4-dioxygenase, alpha subunit